MLLKMNRESGMSSTRCLRGRSMAGIPMGSDIVWGRYGGDTIAELAERIVSKLDQQGN